MPSLSEHVRPLLLLVKVPSLSEPRLFYTATCPTPATARQFARLSVPSLSEPRLLYTAACPTPATENGILDVSEPRLLKVSEHYLTRMESEPLLSTLPFVLVLNLHS